MHPSVFLHLRLSPTAKSDSLTDVNENSLGHQSDLNTTHAWMNETK